jgi:hypothetical protein
LMAIDAPYSRAVRAGLTISSMTSFRGYGAGNVMHLTLM